MSLNIVAAHLATMSDVTNDQLHRAPRLRALVMTARMSHGYQRRDALRQATWGIANLEIGLNDVTTRQTQVLQELIQLRDHHASYPEMGRIFRIFHSVAAHNMHPVEHYRCKFGPVTGMRTPARSAVLIRLLASRCPRQFAHSVRLSDPVPVRAIRRGRSEPFGFPGVAWTPNILSLSMRGHYY